MRLLLNKKKIKKSPNLQKINLALVTVLARECNLEKKNPIEWSADERRKFFNRLIQLTKLSFDEQLELSHDWVESLIQMQYQNELLGVIHEEELSIFEKIIVNKINSKISNHLIQTEYLCDILNVPGDGNCLYRCIAYHLAGTFFDLPKINATKKINGIDDIGPKYKEVRIRVSSLVKSWLDGPCQDELVNSVYGTIEKKYYILNAFLEGIWDDLFRYGVIGFQNTYFNKLENVSIEKKKEFIYFWAEIISLGDCSESRKLLIENLIIEPYHNEMNEYFFNPINGRRLPSPNSIVKCIFWGTWDILFILGNEYSLSFVILFQVYDYLGNRKIWTNRNYGPNNDKSYYIKFTGSHYDVINLIGKPDTQLISSK